MDNILYFLVIGVLFYFMMRKGGCGMGMMGHSHSGQGEGHSHGGHTDTSKKDIRKDPVCEMGIEIDHARFISSYQDRTFYFCSESCKSRFEDTPDRFIEPKVSKRGGCC
ncbi:MAG: YHS domain-containing protein [Thermodesulfobacteriota bacterium]